MWTSIAISGELARRASSTLRWFPWAAYIGYGLVVTTLALRHVSPEHFALFWDDALFFERVAYNLLHHGSAAWNVADGPVFVNTSQLFQLLAAGLLWLFPGYYNAAVTLWGAVALCLTLPVLVTAARAGPLGALLAFCLMQAPPTLLSLTTGMETPTVFLLLSGFSYTLSRLRGESWQQLLTLAGWQLIVYAVRPDAILLSFGATLLMLVGRRQTRSALAFVLISLLGLGLLSLAFYAYYGTALPLSTFLKVSPLSIYDADYLSMGRSNKLKNLAQMAVLIVPLLPLIGARRDLENLALTLAGAVFIAFHAATTYEIAAYHARFYAPALPFFFVAALRGVQSVQSRRHGAWLVIWGLAASVLLGALYRLDWIESEGGYGPDIVRLFDHARYAVGVPALGLSVLLGVGALPVALLGALVAVEVAHSRPSEWGIVSDELSNNRTIDSHTADVGIDVIKRCFPEPLRLTHSEIGLPGVLFPESTVIDFTGLANPSIVHHSFDFEALCEDARPEFIFRPHWSHRAMNQTLDESDCLAANYTAVDPPRRASCPLLVRNDLFERYQECANDPGKSK